MDARRHVATCGLPFSESTPDAPNIQHDGRREPSPFLLYALCAMQNRSPGDKTNLLGYLGILHPVHVTCAAAAAWAERSWFNAVWLWGLVAVLFLGSGHLARVPTPLALTLGRLRDFDSFFAI